MKHGLYILGGTVLIAAGALGMAPPAASDAAASSGDADQGPSASDAQGRSRVTLELRIDPEALRTRLNRSILRAEQMLDRHRAALAKLDEGASAGEVLAELRFDALGAGGDEQQATHASPTGDRRPHRPAGSLGPDERTQMHAFLSEYFPELWANLSPIIEQDARNADRLLARMSPQIREILLLRETEPELADIKIQQMRIGLDFVEALRVYRAALRLDDTHERQRVDAMATLRDLAAARFDAELRAKQYEIDRLRNRLGELEQSVEQIEDRRDAEIEHMLATAVRSARRQAAGSEDTSGND